MCWSREDYGKPSQFLIENSELLPSGKALDIAMGSGRNTLYLAEKGMEVEGIDISHEDIQQALDTARERGLKINARVSDTEGGKYYIEKNAYDLIICFNYLYRPLIPMIKEGLRKGGIVIYETYLIEQADYGKPKNPAFLLKHNELLDMFRDLRCLRYREGMIAGRGFIASLVAEKE
jgi:SAM-dependent methyltransferase